jgi:hypothetical protein
MRNLEKDYLVLKFNKSFFQSEEKIELSSKALMLYVYLCAYICTDLSLIKGVLVSFPGRDRLMKSIGMSKNTLKKCVEELTNIGWLKVSRKYHHYTEYRVGVVESVESSGKVKLSWKYYSQYPLKIS